MKCPALLPALFLLASPAAGQCVAFLAPPEVPVYMDDAGRTRSGGIRKDLVILMPALKMSFNQGVQVKIKEDISVSEVATCYPEDFKTNPKTGLTKFWMQVGGGTFVGIWTKAADLIKFTYEAPGSYQNQSGEANMLTVRHGADLALDKIKSASFKPPQVENQHTFPASFDKVWAALVETFSDQKWQVESIDKSSGLITTKPAVDSSGGSMVCATKFDEAHKTWLNVFVKVTDTGTRVKVNATFRAMREDQAITCYSSGAIETSLFEGISKNL
jgi:hypothetical protein